MAYAQLTQAQLAQEIAVALQDPDHVYWTLDEIYRAINEGLLYWGALTSYWRERGVFNTTATVPIYDLATLLPTLRARTYTLGDLTNEILYHFLEPPSGAPAGVAGTGDTDQFAIGQITSVLTRKRNEFTIDSRVPLHFDTIPVPFTPGGILELDGSISLISRAAWTDQPTGIISPLNLEDAWSAQSYNPLWTLEPGKPFALSAGETQPLQIQFIPPPIAAGTLELVYTQTIAMAIADGTAFAVPDEFVHAIKYASMYELLAVNNQGYDAQRAQYCVERYKAYMEVTKLHRSLIRIYLNNRPLPVDIFQALESARPNWQNKLGTPDFCAVAFDLFGLSNVPNQVFGMSADVIRSAPLPAATTDFIQMGREEIPYLMDFCRHVLSFKMGGSDFVATMALYDNFIAGAVQRNKLLKDKIPYMEPLFNPSMKEQQTEPVA